MFLGVSSFFKQESKGDVRRVAWVAGGREKAGPLPPGVGIGVSLDSDSLVLFWLCSPESEMAQICVIKTVRK